MTDPSDTNPFVVAARQENEMAKRLTEVMADNLLLGVENHRLKRENIRLWEQARRKESK